MERITLKNLRFRALHGYYPEEQQQGNDFEVDILIDIPFRRAGETDVLVHTIDYGEAAGLVARVMKSEPVRLLETLALRIECSLRERYPEATGTEVAIRKMSPPMDPSCDYAEVRIRWPK